MLILMIVVLLLSALMGVCVVVLVCGVIVSVCLILSMGMRLLLLGVVLRVCVVFLIGSLLSMVLVLVWLVSALVVVVTLLLFGGIGGGTIACVGIAVMNMCVGVCYDGVGVVAVVGM